MGIFDDGGWLDNLLPGGKVTWGKSTAAPRQERRPAPSRPPSFPASAPAPQWSPGADWSPPPAIAPTAAQRPAAQSGGGDADWLRTLFNTWNNTTQQQAEANRIVGAGVMGDREAAAQASARVLALSPEGAAAAERGGALESSAADLEQQAEARRRALLVQESTGAARPGFHAKELTDQQYGALPVRQQAAVDFNTQLVAAVAADKALGQTDAKVENKEYDATLQRMFGERGASDTYAPNTVALLQQVDFEDKAADLDQFLGLQASVTEKDLGSLTPRADRLQQGVPGEYRSARATSANNITNGTLSAMSQVLAKGQTLLQASAPAAASFGAPGGSGSVQDALAGAGTAATSPGFGSSQADWAVQTFFEEMAKAKPQQPITEADISAGLGVLQQQYGVAPADFARYADTRLRATEYGRVLDQKTPLGADTSVNYKTPEQFRTEFGL